MTSDNIFQGKLTIKNIHHSEERQGQRGLATASATTDPNLQEMEDVTYSRVLSYSHTPYSLLTPAVLLGKLHWIVLLVTRKVLPNGRFHTRENTKQHSKHTPLFCPSSHRLVQGAFQHFGLDANDTLC